jgi:hypothetical protein
MIVVLPCAVLAAMMRVMYLARRAIILRYELAMNRRAFHHERAAAIRRVVWGRAVVPQWGTWAGAYPRPFFRST